MSLPFSLRRWAHGDVPAGVENVTGTSHGDWLYGSAGVNKLYGDDGNDILSGGGGNNLTGGGGNDVALFSGLQQDYHIYIQNVQVMITDLRPDSNDGQDITCGIETIRFGDGSEMSLTGTSALANGGVARAEADGAYETAQIRIASDVAGFGESPSDLLSSRDFVSGQTHSSPGMYHF